jgi:pimeloyl-ACP methyl ester carboxylesterase
LNFPGEWRRREEWCKIWVEIEEGLAMSIALRTITANGISMRIAEAGSGPIVLFCHGWPEGWSSWRHQMDAVAGAGFRVVAPDMRGYGETEAPADIDRYTLMDLVGDMVGLLAELGEKEAVIVGHDWGAFVAWHAAFWRPDLFRAVIGMSVPWTPPGKVDMLASLEAAGIRDFYIQHFQTPGVAEKELDADPLASLRRIYYSTSGDMREKGKGFGRLVDGTLLGNTVEPDTLPAWLPAEHLETMAQAFRKSGFRGGLNWYRNMSRNWRLSQVWRGQIIRQPALFIAGSRDGVLRFPASMAQIEAYPRTLPGCRGVHILEGAGHWIQQERAEEVSRLVVDFLKGL